MKCAKCGRQSDSRDATFCSSCGTRLAHSKANPAHTAPKQTKKTYFCKCKSPDSYQDTEGLWRCRKCASFLEPKIADTHGPRLYCECPDDDRPYTSDSEGWKHCVACGRMMNTHRTSFPQESPKLDNQPSRTVEKSLAIIGKGFSFIEKPALSFAVQIAAIFVTILALPVTLFLALCWLGAGALLMCLGSALCVTLIGAVFGLPLLVYGGAICVQSLAVPLVPYHLMTRQRQDSAP